MKDDVSVDSYSMDLYDAEIRGSSDGHPLEVAFEFRDYDERFTWSTTHRLKINANHLIHAAINLSNKCVDDPDENNQIYAALRLLKRRAIRMSRRLAKDNVVNDD